MTVLVFLFWIWFNPTQVVRLEQLNQGCLIILSQGGNPTAYGHRVGQTSCDQVAEQINASAGR